MQERVFNKAGFQRREVAWTGAAACAADFAAATGKKRGVAGETARAAGFLNDLYIGKGGQTWI
ncbi:hypothetical protein ABD76_11815 [Paenibacillus dendritiformis]|nr:hypothetical protein [Paenibacillus dendritiformis]